MSSNSLNTVLAGSFSSTLPVDHHSKELGEVVAIAIQTIFSSSSVLSSKQRECTAALSSRMSITADQEPRSLERYSITLRMIYM